MRLGNGCLLVFLGSVNYRTAPAPICSVAPNVGAVHEA